MSRWALMTGTYLAPAFPAAAGERLAGRAHVVDGGILVVDGIHVRLKGVAAPKVASRGGQVLDPASSSGRRRLADQ